LVAVQVPDHSAAGPTLVDHVSELVDVRGVGREVGRVVAGGADPRWRSADVGRGVAQAEGPGSRVAGLAMAFKLIEAAELRWRAVNAAQLVALVRAGATFRHGKLVERSDGDIDAQAVA